MSKIRERKSSKIKVLCACALLAAAAVTIAYVCKFLTIGSIRITFENMPIIMAGIFFGPFAGFATGICADLVSTAFSQYGIGGINPLITLGAGMIGFTAGLFYRLPILKKKERLNTAAAVFSAHIIGNMIIKSVALMIYFHYQLPAILPRIPLYAVIGTIEFIIISIIMKSKGMQKSVKSLKG